MVKIVTHDVNFSSHCTFVASTVAAEVDKILMSWFLYHMEYITFNTSQNKRYETIEKKNCLAKVRRRLTPSAQYSMAESACYHFCSYFRIFLQGVSVQKDKFKIMITVGFKEGFCIQFFRPRTRPKTFLQCFALEQRESKAKHCRNVLGRVLE